MNFQVCPLPRNHFEHLFSMPQDLLASYGGTRLRVTEKPGFPCRISLEDAEVGEEVLLVNYEHLKVQTPFHSRYAVYVRVLGKPARPALNEIPEMLRTRILSLRAWGHDGMLVGAELVNGEDIESAIAALFEIPQSSYIHVHFVKPGCYAARIDRA